MTLESSFRLDCSQALRGRLKAALKKAYAIGHPRLIKRITALLMLSDGLCIRKVAELVAVCQQTVRNWLRAFLSEGLSSLKYRKPPGRKPKLTKSQKQRLGERLQAGPLEAGFPTACWDSILVQQLIYQEFGVLYSRYYVCQLLRNLGFSYQKARFEADRSAEQEQKRQKWLAQTWPQALAQAERRQALLLFGDEATLGWWGSLSYTWAPRGQQPVVKTSGRRKGYKLFGLIDCFTGRFFYKGHTGRFNSETYQAFLEEVMQQTDQPIVLIQDGARYHTSKALQTFFQKHQQRLTVYQLPAYSPDYNPIEFLWKKLRKKATHNRYFETFEALVTTADQALLHLAQCPEEITSLMGRYCRTLGDTQDQDTQDQECSTQQRKKAA